MFNKPFLEKVLRERDKLENLLNRIGFTRRMTLKGVVGNWSIKDLIAHLWAYEQYIADRLAEIAQGETYSPCTTYDALAVFRDEFGYPDFGSPLLDDAEPNDWVYERYRNVPLEEIVAQELQAFTSIVTTLEALPEDVVKHYNLLNRVADNTYHHYREHIRDIKAWLKTNALHLK